MTPIVADGALKEGNSKRRRKYRWYRIIVPLMAIITTYLMSNGYHGESVMSWRAVVAINGVMAPLRISAWLVAKRRGSDGT